MKTILQLCLGVSLIFCMISCNADNDDMLYVDKHYFYKFDTETSPLEISSLAYSNEFLIKDDKGNIGIIDYISYVVFCTPDDTILVDNQEISAETLKMGPISDVVENDWFSVRLQDNKLKVTMKENQSGAPRKVLVAAFAGKHDPKIDANYVSCGNLEIMQLPSAN